MNYTYVPLPLVEEAQSVSASAQVLVIDDGEVKRTDAANIGIKPTGKLTLTNTTETDCTNYATAQIVDANLLAENIKKDVTILGTTGSYEGGGSSDFSTAEVTITNNTSGAVGVNVPYADDNNISVAYTSAGNLIDTTIIAILYKGKAQFEIADDGSKIGNVTGDITADDDYTATITGSGTITIVVDE